MKFSYRKKINRALKTKIYKHMAAKSKKMYIDKLDERLDKYNKHVLEQ